MIPLRIHLFARARDLAGTACLELLVEPGTTVGQLRERLGREVPTLGPILARCAIAVDQDFAGDDRPLPAGAVEVALIPPVSGG
jgi:molybdopterin converting factor small subunit